MSISALPNVVDALLNLARTLESVQVLDSYGNTQDPGDYLMVGVDDPNNLETARGGDATSDWRYVGHNTITEQGTVNCAALSWNGDGDLAAARLAAFDTVDRIVQSIKTDPTLGNACQSCVVQHLDYIPNMNGDGAEVIVVFIVNYTALV